MRKSFLTPFKVGLVVLAGIIVAVVMISRVGSKWGSQGETYSIHAYFDDVTGLAEKSQVRIAGIAVGEIETIELVNNRAKVTLRILTNVELFEGLPLPSGTYIDGATISKKLSSLLGDYYIEITPGLQGALLEDGDEIKNVVQGGGPEAILNEVEKITRDVSDITGSLSDVFGGDEGRARLDAIFRDVEDTSSTIRELAVQNSERLDRIIDNVEKLTADARIILQSGGEDVDTILANVREVSRELKVIVAQAGGRVDQGFNDVDRTLASAQQAIEKLDRSLANIETVTEGMRDGNGTVGHILTDDTIALQAEELLGDTRELVASASEAVDSANAVLGSISRLDTIVDLRNDYMVGFNAFKNVFSLKLQPKPTKWYVIELIRDPRGKTSTVRRTTDGTGEQPVFEVVTETDAGFKFSFEFAGRYEFIAGRFGLIENTGGIGGNLYFVDDNLELIVDLFDFGFGPYPRARAYGLLYFDMFMPWQWSEHLYLSGGVDDPFNDGTRDYFVGAGFNFNDEDLKGLLTVAPTPSL
ncbi:MAG: hypothetical protein AUK47_28075 [Deltaproteobacteria bacterium CG2_30_63_29]|nr:MAG: hypothetical protein AUK47_28075 [Deltaproteobacteria bacterium CG2_30_63_29]PJB33222.1 MAG: hypothetical protein CO108_31410 [Deltaproteobacteria bacterium CG_4_9_14_3_um_filter_63_12]